MTCPIGMNVLAACARKRPDKDPCESCVDDFNDRAAIISDGCRLTQPQADKIAREQIISATPGQLALIA